MIPDRYSTVRYVRGRWGKKHRSKVLATIERRSLNKHTRQYLNEETKKAIDDLLEDLDV